MSLIAGLYSLEERGASTLVARRLDRGQWTTEAAVSSPETGTCATRQPLLPTWISLLHGAKRAPAPNNRHSLRGLAQANSLCSPHVHHTTTPVSLHGGCTENPNGSCRALPERGYPKNPYT